MKCCSKCGTYPLDDLLFESTDGRHEILCFDCLAEKAGVKFVSITMYYADGEFLGYDDDIDDVIDYMTDMTEYKEVEE